MRPETEPLGLIQVNERVCGEAQSAPNALHFTDKAMKSWPQTTKELTAQLRNLRDGAPQIMKAFSSMAQAASAAKALDRKTKELIALGICVAVRCDDCIAFHAGKITVSSQAEWALYIRENVDSTLASAPWWPDSFAWDARR